MTGEKRKRKSWSGRRRVAGFLILALCCMLGAAGGVYISHRKAPDKTEGLAYEANIVMGDIPGKTPEERQKELDSVVEEGVIAMSISGTSSGKAAGVDRGINWPIENPSNQGKLIRVEVTRDDTGRKIYKTGAIPPRSYVEEAPPDVMLEAGIYDCTTISYVCRQENEKYIGQTAVKLKLMLLE